MILRASQDLPWTPVSHNPEIQKQVFLDPGTVPNLIQFAQAIFKPGQKAPAHSHQTMTETFLVNAGTLTITVNDQTYSLSAGSMITLEVGEEHELRNDSDRDLHLTYFGISSKSPNE